MIRSIAIVFIFVMPWQTLGAEYSMMLNKQERQTVQKLEQKNSPDHIIYLSGILHLNESQWTIWVNGQTISSEQPSKTFEVCKVKSDCIEIAYKNQNFILKPNQTINLTNGQIFTGDKRQDIATTEEITDDFDF